MSDAVRRGIRTALWFVLAAIPVIPTVAEVLDIPAGTVAKVVAVLTAVGSVLTAVINHAEDTGAIPAILKAPPSPGENPIP